jgi:hypothetical protein
MGCCSVVGIATRYGLDGLWFESRWGQDFRIRPAAHPASNTMTASLSRGCSGRGVVLPTHPDLAPRLKKE